MPNERDHGPLHGVVLCWTSIAPDQRGEMAKVAEEMGAVTKLDLTSDVTHLIVGALDTPKYQYVAKEREDIKVLALSWLDAVRASWLRGGDTPVASIEEQHALPALAGLQISITAFEDPHERAELTNAITAHGATYHGDLTRKVTHLIAARPEGQKHFHAGQWGIKIVSVEWLWHSLARGMALDESLFHLSIPSHERGIGAVTKRQPQSLLGKRARDSPSLGDAKTNAKRKLRRTASVKLESQNDDLWADIGSGETASGRAQPADWDEQLGVKAEINTNAIDDSLATTTTALGSSTGPEETTALPNEHESPLTVFQGRRVYTHGFRPVVTQALHDHLTSNGANVVDKDLFLEAVANELPVTAVVPHNASKDVLESVRRLGGKGPSALASEWWVEQCVYKKAYIEPHMPWAKPIQTFPIRGFSQLKICPTSFKAFDLLHFSKVVPLLGARYDEHLRQDISVLVSSQDQPNPEKIKYAVSHGIPIVSHTWLWTCVEKGKLVPFEQFLLTGRRKQADSVVQVRSESHSGKSQDKQPLQELEHLVNSGTRPTKSRSRSVSLERAMHSKVPQQGAKVHRVQENGTRGSKSRQPRTNEHTKAGRLVEEIGANVKAFDDALATLLAHKKETADKKPSTRRHRTLGRATSNPSSLGASAMSSEHHTPCLEDAGDEDEDEAHPKKQAFKHHQPSQAISYEVEDAVAARERLGVRTGVGALDGAEDGGMKRVESIGVVKDVDVCGGSVEGKRRGGRRR